MNTGIISSRYAKALLRFSSEEGDSEKTCSQAMTLEKAFKDLPELRQIMSDPAAVSMEDKMSLMVSALGDEPMTGSLRKFLELVLRAGRIDDIRFILRSFINQYFKSRNIRFATIVTANEPDPPLVEKIRTAAKQRLGGEIMIETKVDPSIIGGIIFTVDDYRVDSSVKTQLETLAKEFTDRNKRIV